MGAQSPSEFFQLSMNPHKGCHLPFFLVLSLELAVTIVNPQPDCPNSWRESSLAAPFYPAALFIFLFLKHTHTPVDWPYDFMGMSRLAHVCVYIWSLSWRLSPVHFIILAIFITSPLVARQSSLQQSSLRKSHVVIDVSLTNNPTGLYSGVYSCGHWSTEKSNNLLKVTD